MYGVTGFGGGPEALLLSLHYYVAHRAQLAAMLPVFEGSQVS
jgi:hypothetical protein